MPLRLPLHKPRGTPNAHGDHHHINLRCFLLLFIQFLFLFLLFSSPIASASNNEALVLQTWLQGSSHSASPPSAFSNWNPSDPNPCKWSFITCSWENFVTEINIQSVSELELPFPSNISTLSHLERLTISGSNLTGEIPPEIGDCSLLTLIDLSSNNLIGDIPSSLGKLKDLLTLDLSGNQLTGEIPKELGDCLSLKDLNLIDNQLSGKLPAELAKLKSLEYLRAGGNKDISGAIPEEIGHFENLTLLGLAVTKISGSLPASIGKLSKLQTLSIYTTMLSGEIPPELGNCSELVDLYLYQNSLSGSLPSEIGKLQKLENLLLWQNNLSGEIPEEIGNCSSLLIIDLSLNALSGSIPQSFGKLSNLQQLMLSNNNISGSIPSVISNASNLMQMQVDSNQLTGSIPPEIGKLRNLNVFFAWQNKLEGSIPSSMADCTSLETLDLSHNALNGSIPSSLFELKNLTKLLLISNHISGSVPPEIGHCKSLVRLRISKNMITGEIPKEIGYLSSLSFLDLSENHLSGSIPAELSKCTELQMLSLSNNALGGYLPDSLQYLTRLQAMDLSGNQLKGQIPESFGQLTTLDSLILRRNSLSGPIPSSVGSCSGLQLLDLSHNNLSGTIPTQLFKIENLDIALNLSWNGLSGEIPPQVSDLKKLSTLDLSHNKLNGSLMPLSGLENLVSLNISYNDFKGFLPDSKLFRQISSTELEGNPGLCSGGHDSCFLGSNSAMQSSRERQSRKIKVAISLLAALTMILVILGIIAVFRARKMTKEDTDSESGGDSWPWQFTPFQKLEFSVDQILKSLVEDNVIGKGCSGKVYRAELENGEVIAVKKLWPLTMVAQCELRKDNHNHNNSKSGTNGGVRDSFSTEVKTLGSVRHKNIVRFLGCCWNRRTRLLMYDYMPNGSLASVLHEKGSGRCLDWDVRYKIILGSAQGLAYLHHDCVPPIVHRDIKANNILIGHDFEPYIADFGLAKLVKDGDFARSSNTVAGSLGYIAPEYGSMLKITEKTDVYSYGVVLLEVLTGKQPIDPTIPDGLHLADWVRRIRTTSSAIEALDPALRGRPEPEIDEMVQALGVALLCVNPAPDDRPTMKDVSAMLKEIRQDRGAVVDTLMKKTQPLPSKGSEGRRGGGSGGPSTAMAKDREDGGVYGTRSSNTSFSASSSLRNYSTSSESESPNTDVKLIK